jgi:hypothetical protein
MSAYVVENKTINKILAYFQHQRTGNCLLSNLQELGHRADCPQGCEILGQAMHDLNVRSVLERYSDCDEKNMPGNCSGYEFHAELPPPAVHAVKALGCFLYQSCEGDCEADDLYLVLDDIKHKLAYAIVCQSEAYDSAPWG